MYLGIEIGGTKLQLGLGRGDGTLAGLWRGTVDVAAGGEGIRRQITAAVPELLARAGVERAAVRGVGVGFGGPVEDATRTVIKSHQIQGWDKFPLADWLAEMLGWPVALGNDADVAGLAEALFGAGKGLSPIFYITIGSGIGGGFIINGEIYRGCGRGAAEIGHLRFMFLKQDNTSGEYKGEEKVLEEVASGWSIEDHARVWARACLDTGNETRLLSLVHGKPEKITARDVARAAEEGDEDALGMLHRAEIYLADAICQVITLLCPRRIIIGGGISLIGNRLLFEPLRRIVAMRVFEPFTDCYDIVPAALGEEVVVLGALALARRRLQPSLKEDSER
jgi:glucokinase